MKTGAELFSNAPTMAPDRRLHELDSVRGLAALAVAAFHFYLGWLYLARPSGLQALALKILYPLYAGPEAVRLFFVLSGLVLALPYVHGRGRSYSVFLTRRVLRIYGPYLVALLLSVAGAAIWHSGAPRELLTDCCWSQPVSWRLVLQHVAFLGDYDYGQYNVVIWSLVHEMRISIIFPALFLLVDRLSTRGALALAAGCTGTAMLIIRFLPQLISPVRQLSLVMTLHYVAFFILGILMAKHLSGIGSWYGTLSKAARMVLFLASFCLYNYSAGVAAGLLGSHLKLLEAASDWGTVAGAVGIIVTALFSVRAKRMLKTRVPMFLGRISYSLYLVHVPVLLALTYSLHRTVMGHKQMFPVYLAAALVAAYLFCIGVEEPLTRLGHRVGRRQSSEAGAARPHADGAVDAAR